MRKGKGKHNEGNEAGRKNSRREKENGAKGALEDVHKMRKGHK